MVKDPVCEIACNENTALKSKFKGKTYYFCAQDCKKVFDLNPEEHAGEYGGED